MKYVASRLSDGNKLFPAKIEITDTGVEVKIPGFLGGKSTFLAFDQISNVSVDSKLVGFSTITFNASGSRAVAHGFKKSQVKEIQAAIEKGKASMRSSEGGSGTTINVGAKKKGFWDFASDQMNKTSTEEAGIDKILRERKEKKEISAQKATEIAQITISSDPDEIQNQLSELISMHKGISDKKTKGSIQEKMEFGIMKLKSAGKDAEASFFETKLAELKKSKFF